MFQRRTSNRGGDEHQCALCHLRHSELLDAAHIKEDADGGEPTVPNGMAMCAIHHRAFDSLVLGVSPTFKIEIRPDVMDEQDGPTLRYSLQGLHGSAIILPHQRAAHPDKPDVPLAGGTSPRSPGRSDQRRTSGGVPLPRSNGLLGLQGCSNILLL